VGHEPPTSPSTLLQREELLFELNVIGVAWFIDRTILLYLVHLI